MTEYISEKYNVIYKGLDSYKQVTQDEAFTASTKENFKCFQFKHEYHEKRTKTFIRTVSFKGGPIFSDWNS